MNEVSWKNQIKEEVDKRNITQVIHCTTINNLSGIMRYGIFSISKLKENEIAYEKLDNERFDNRKSYISCSISKRNTHYFAAKGLSFKNGLIEITIDPKILFEKKCLFLYYNAASYQFIFMDEKSLMGVTPFRKMFDPLLKDPRKEQLGSFIRSNSTKLSETTKEQAEVMIPDSIELNYIISIKLNEKLLTEDIKLIFNQNNIEIIDSEEKIEETFLSPIFESRKQFIINSNYLELGLPFEIYMMTSENHKNKSIEAVYFNILCRGTTIKLSKNLEKENYDEYTIRLIYKFQILLLLMSKYGYFDNNELIINVPYGKVRDSILIANRENNYWLSQIALLSLDPSLYFSEKSIVFSDRSDLSISLNRIETNNISDNMIYVFDKNHTDEYNDMWFDNKIDYSIVPFNKGHEKILTGLLKYIFDFDEFRDGQMNIIANFLNGNNTIGILPTSGGKSLTFYFCILLQPVLTLIVAPINSLIIDQCNKLIDVFHINSVTKLIGDNFNLQRDLEDFGNNKFLFTYTSPERIQIRSFREKLIKLGESNIIGSIILDEVHCLSEWGHDFRISYLMLSYTLNKYCKNIGYLGLTATASLAVIKDLMSELSIEKQDIIYLKKLRRSNLFFQFVTFASFETMKEHFSDFLDDHYKKKSEFDIDISNTKNNAILVFSQTKNSRNKTGVNDLYSIYSKQYPTETTFYHGDDKSHQLEFTKNQKTLMFATKAFGMGVDKSNIRATIHFGMTPSRESYYQEAGRAGRDGCNASCQVYSIESNIDDDLINKVLDPQTKIDEITPIISKLSDHDISTVLFFYRNQLDTPEYEAEVISKFFNQLIIDNNLAIRPIEIQRTLEEGYYCMVLSEFIKKTSEQGNVMWELKFQELKYNMSLYGHLVIGKPYTKNRFKELTEILHISDKSTDEKILDKLISEETILRIYLKIEEYNGMKKNKIDVFQPVLQNQEVIVSDIDIEKYLYVLHKIGVVENWSINYKGNRGSYDIHIIFDPQYDDIDHIKKKAKEYICSYELINVESALLDGIDYATSMIDLPIIIKHVRRWYHNTFTAIKREQIANMYSLIKRFKNENRSDEIQNLIEEYFDISSYIGNVGESFLNFEGKGIDEVAESAFERSIDSLEKTKLQIERALESFIDNKIDVFSGIIHLRSNSFLVDRNGKNRFDEALKKLSSNELDIVNQVISNHYKSLTNFNRLNYINSFKHHDDDIINKLHESNKDCPVINGIFSMKINDLLGKEWN